MPAEDLASVAGGAFNQLITDQLAVERSLKDSLAQRGITIVTTSGTLVTLVFGFTALTSPARAAVFHTLPAWIRAAFVVGLAFFVVAIAFGMAVNSPRTYREVDEPGFKTMLTAQYWNAPDPIQGALVAAQSRTEIIASFRERNGTNAMLVRWGVAAELAAVLLLALATAGIVLRG